MKVPENAREMLAEWRGYWLIDLALRALDYEAAASEAVTEEMEAAGVAVADFAHEDEVARIIKAVAPALLLAGERRGLERAAERNEQIAAYYERIAASWQDGTSKAELLGAARTHREAATAIRALIGRPA